MSKTDPQSAALVAQALQGAQEHLAALAAMQHQTAATHRAFLEGQAAAQTSFQALLDGQQRLIEAMVGLPARGATPVYAAPAPVIAPPPVYAAPAPAVVAPAVVIPPPVAPSVVAPRPAPVALVTAPAPPAAPVDVVGTLLAVVAEATGYPTDMLELDMDLESDLGIDSIKRVEILSLLTDRLPNTPTVEPERLSALQTLRQVAEFVGAHEVAPATPVSAAPAVAASAPPMSAAPASGDDAATVLIQVVADATGYPTDMLELDMDLESDLGIDSIKRVEILSLLTERLPNTPTVEPESLGRLQTLRQVLEFVTGDAPAVESETPPEPDADEPLPERRAVRSVPFVDAAADRPLPLAKGEVLWVVDDGSDLAQALAERLTALGLIVHLVDAHSDNVPAPAGLVLTGTDLRVAFSVLRTAGPHLAAAAERGSGMLVSLSRLDGAFGTLDGSRFTSDDALTAGLAGYLKTAAWEWPGLWCRAVDVCSSHEDDESVADWLLEELRSAGPIEVGLDAQRNRRRLVLEPIAAPDEASQVPAGLVLVTGGARGVTADCAVALAEAGSPAFLLLGRTPLPDAEPSWLDGVGDDGVQAAVLAHGFAGGRPSPKELRSRVRALLAAREVRSSLARIEAMGASASYAAADVRDVEAVSKATRRAERSLKLKVSGVLHGAGVLRDKLITDKSDDDVDAVLGTKLDGLRAVLGAVGGRPLQFLGLFASVTGRYGRRGQSDYAAANRVLDALAAREAARRPETRVVSWSWGPWDGGMVTAELKKAFTREGVALIHRAGGAAVCVQEALSAPGRAVSIVVGDGLDSGGDSPEPVVVHRPLALGVESWPVLADHQLDGSPVLPFALSMEFLAREALREHAGFRLVGLDDVRVLKGVVLDDEVELTPRLTTTVVSDEQTSVTVELVDDSGRTRVRGVAVLAPNDSPSADVPTAVDWPSDLLPYPGGTDAIYGHGLFHGPAFQCIETVHGTWESGIAASLRRAPAPVHWQPQTAQKQWSIDPLVVDGIFQAMILWCRVATGAPSLPSRVARLRLYGPWPADTVRVVATVRRRRGNNVLADVDLLGADGRLVARMDGYTCTAAPSLEAAFTKPPAARSAAPPA